MGEAKQRRLAIAKGQPWDRDIPKKPEHPGQYLGDDGEWHYHDDLPKNRRRGVNFLAVAAMLGVPPVRIANRLPTPNLIRLPNRSPVIIAKTRLPNDSK